MTSREEQIAELKEIAAALDPARQVQLLEEARRQRAHTVAPKRRLRRSTTSAA